MIDIARLYAHPTGNYEPQPGDFVLNYFHKPAELFDVVQPHDGDVVALQRTGRALGARTRHGFWVLYASHPTPEHKTRFVGMCKHGEVVVQSRELTRSELQEVYNAIAEIGWMWRGWAPLPQQGSLVPPRVP